MIFFKKDPVLGVDMESAINNAVFPGLQVGCSCMLEVDLDFLLYGVSPSHHSQTNRVCEMLCRAVLIITQLVDWQFA
jgi:hypothetical protein